MEPLVIVGFSFKLPQEVEDEKSLWSVLESRRNLMTEWPETRARTESFRSTGNKKLNTLHARGAHFISEDPAVFDAPFFSITAKEAAAMDPQHRWALETAFHAFENAGMPVESLRGSDIAVFAASMLSDYHSILLKDPDTMPQQATTGTVASMLANRLSWYFDLRGPSVHIDTACSSSMTALDMACQAIRGGDSSASLVIGTNLLLNPEMSLFLSNMNFLSPSGRCFSFDSRADGYGRGEGIVAIIIKPLDDALRDGNVIRAVIRSSASNQDGRTPGLTQPSADAQEALIRRVYAKAGLTLDETRYFEAHGTGTSLGDPIETTAIGKVFGALRSPEDPLLVGSIKANIGHLEGASGLAGIAKCIMVLERGVIPPNALLKEMNPAIDATSLHLQVPLEKVPWPSAGLRRISVNSFGFGGANSHVILDDAFHFLRNRGLSGHHNTNPTPNPTAIPASTNGITNGLSTASNGEKSDDDTTDASAAPKLLVWTAADASALQRVLRSYARYYHDTVSGNSHKLAQLAYTLADRRSIMAWRAFTVLDGTSGDEGESVPSMTTSPPVRASVGGNGIVFIFTGQGAQYAGMGLTLVKRYALFAQRLERSNSVLKKMGCKWTLLDELGNSRNMHRPDISQPLCTILQVALVDLLRSFGLSPAAVVGHSSGELAAAYAAGALSHDSVCKMAYVRGKLVGKLFDAQRELGTMSSMMSVNLTAAEVPQWLDKLSPNFGTDAIYVACFNSANNLTLSGSAKALHALKLLLDEEGIFAYVVNTGIAYHSPAMRAIASEYHTLMTSLDIHLDSEPSSRRVPMISTVTGTLVSAKLLATPRYWVDNLVSPVLFVQALQRLVASIADPALSLGIDALSDFVEIGPHGALQRPIRDCLFGVSPAPRYHSILHRSQNPVSTTLSLLGELFCRGHAVSLLQANGQCRGELAPLVDCPPYPFDHSRRYWSESRISSDFRFRKGLSGHMLGRRSNDWNTLQPRWRSWLCTETMPWLGDHVVSDTTLCPGVGLVIMALEAVKQLYVADDTALRGFYIKEAHFIAPITVGATADDATETELHLRRIQTAYEKSATWCEARIFSYCNGRWTECFHARIQIQLEQTAAAPTPVDGGRETRYEQQRIRDCVEQAHSACRKSIGSREFYNYCAANGNRYGESFRLLDDVAWDGHGISVARIDMTATILYEETIGSPVHPTVLDAAMQLLFTQISQGLTGPMPALVPYKVTDTWISSRVWDKTTSTVRISSVLSDDLEFISRRKGTIYAIADDGMPLCAIESVILSEVSNPERVPDVGDASRDLLYSIAWKPQFSSLAAEQLQKLYSQKTLANEEATVARLHQTFELAMQRVIKRTMQQVAETDLKGAAAHVRKYWAYLKQQSSSVKGLEPLGKASGEKKATEDSEVESLLAEYEEAEPQWRLLPAVARALPLILRGQTDPLEFLFSSDLARQFYLRLYGRHMHDKRFRSFLELITHENPSLRILEIGAGTGGFTRQILDTLQHLEQQTGQRLFAEYVYTDISPAFFEQGQADFPEFADRMVFQTLNIDKHPLDQGFESARFDVVVAGCVLHATPDLAATLRNTHKLLKPGGLLVLEEITCPEKVSVNVGFGCLEGWWLSTEDWRQNGPLLTDRQWHDLLQDTGLFSGAEVTLRDFESDECHVSSIIVTKAVETKGDAEGETCHDKSHRQDHVVFLIDEDVAAQRSLASFLVRKCGNSHISHIGDFLDGQWPVSAEDIIVFLVEVGRSFLAQITEKAFKTLQALVERNDRILWVAALPARGVLVVDPHCALATGLLRSIRSEQSEKHIVTLVIESGDSDSSTDGAVHVQKVLQSCFLHRTANSSELEFVVRNGQMNIGRLVHEPELDSQRLSSTHARMRKEPWRLATAEGQSLVLRIGTPGMLDTMHFVEDASRDNTLDPDDVEIEASVWPLGFHDIFVALGRLPEQELGIECAGRVKRVGSTSSARFKPGDRVMMFAPGCMRSHPRAPADSVIKIPDGISMHDAVSVLNPLMTAYHSLVNVARLQCGERVLIHAAAGGTGQMAVAVAQKLGAQVFVTVGSEEKKQLMMNHYGIPEHHIFYSRDASFSHGIKRVAGSVHVVLNSLSGDMLRASWECIAPYGRFIEIGKADIIGNSSLPMAHFAKNVMFAAVDLYHIALTDKPLGRKLIEVTLQLVAGGDVRPPSPLHLYPVSETEKAFRYMQSGKNTGRVMITVSDEDVVPKLLVDQTAWRFDPKVSYLVAGGLGGIGRATMRWMASRGARHLISPSRHGISSQAAADVVSELGRAGVQVAVFQCDVSSAAEVSRMLESMSDMPPIRGCINAVMLLQDSIFSNMTHAQWTQTIRSKVNASWNLHSLLPRDMDFFILLSSLGGVYGSPGQSNYAAGCAFQDALAAERTAAGFAGSVSLDLGWMRTIGIVAETDRYRQSGNHIYVSQPVEEADYLAVLEHYCDPGLPPLDRVRSQLLVGAVQPAGCYAAGETPSPMLSRPLFAGFAASRSTRKPTGTDGGKGEDPATLFVQAAGSRTQRCKIVVDALRTKLARALGVQADDVDHRKSLSDYGVDSLMAVELRNWIRRDFRASVTVFEMMGGASMARVGELVAERAVE